MKRVLTREALRFVIAGAVNNVTTLLLYWALLLVVPYWLAYSIVYVTGIAQAYWLNTRLVFRVKPTRHTAIAYPLIYVVQYLLGLLVLRSAVEILRWPQGVAIFLSIAVSMPVTFVLSRMLLKSTQEMQ